MIHHLVNLKLFQLSKFGNFDNIILAHNEEENRSRKSHTVESVRLIQLLPVVLKTIYLFHKENKRYNTMILILNFICIAPVIPQICTSMYFTIL